MGRTREGGLDFWLVLGYSGWAGLGLVESGQVWLAVLADWPVMGGLYWVRRPWLALGWTDLG